ncbi:MAG: hypothetical protein ACJZ9L_03400 [Coraliomargaritaceae bacterium]
MPLHSRLYSLLFRDIRFSQVGFGLPSGGGVTFADASTLKSAFDGRRVLRLNNATLS